jgi:hypothetical protein
VTVLDLRAVYRGQAPYASCHYQCLGNVLEAQGLRHAEGRLCMTWGFAWDGGDRLHGSRRWMEAANRMHGIELAERRFAHPEAAFVAEAELLARGEPFVVGVDSYAIPSEHTGRAHVPHSVVVLGARAGGVAILDPMNLPEASSYDDGAYRAMRSHPCVEDTVLFTSGAAPSRDPADDVLLEALVADLDEHWLDDLAALDAYVGAASWRTGVDVCRVGAERLYLGALLRHLARERPALASVAHGMQSLARRWYLTHTMALQGGERVRRRCEDMVAAMAPRERALRERLIEVVACGGAPDGEPELVDDVL